MSAKRHHDSFHIRQRLMGASALARFTFIGSCIVSAEIILGSWPVVATAIWNSHAVDTWIHFLYWIKAFFLALAILQTRWKPWKFAQDRTSMVDQDLGLLDLCVGATASCELSVWLLISVIAHALLSSIVLLLVLALKHEYGVTVEWFLSWAFDIVAIAESVGSPLILIHFGLKHYSGVHPVAFSKEITDAANRESQKKLANARFLTANAAEYGMIEAQEWQDRWYHLTAAQQQQLQDPRFMDAPNDTSQARIHRVAPVNKNLQSLESRARKYGL